MSTENLVPRTEQETGLTTRDTGRGKSNIGPNDVRLPRIAIAQKTSPQLEPDKAEYIEGLKLYQLYNSATKENYGDGPVEFVVVDMRKRAMQFDDNMKVIDYNVPLNDPRLEWTTDPVTGQRNKPEAVLFFDYIIILATSMLPAVLSLKSTGMKTALQLNTFLKMRRGDTWRWVYKLSAARGASGSFSYGVYQIQPGDKASAQLERLAEETYLALEGRTVTVEPERGDEAIDTEAVPF